MRNPLKSKQRTFKQSLIHGLWIGLASCFALAVPVVAASMQPINMDVVAPEHGAAAKDKAERQVEREMAKCTPLPEGALPGGAVINWADERGTRYTENPGTVGMAFDIAVGVTEQGPRVEGFTLCR